MDGMADSGSWGHDPGHEIVPVWQVFTNEYIFPKCWNFDDTNGTNRPTTSSGRTTNGGFLPLS